MHSSPLLTLTNKGSIGIADVAACDGVVVDGATEVGMLVLLLLLLPLAPLLVYIAALTATAAAPPTANNGTRSASAAGISADLV